MILERSLPNCRRHAAFGPVIALIGAVLLAYSNVYQNQFLLDDEFLILKNEYLKHASTLFKLLTSNSTAGFGGFDAYYRPLQGLLYFLVVQLWGIELFPFHLLNVALHAANACLVYTLGKRLGFNPWASLGAAFVWALHPLHTEAVTYISATADPLYALFCLASLNVLLPPVTPSKMLVSSALFALALFSKETAIVLPGLAILCLFVTSEQRLNWKTYSRTWPLWLTAALYLVLRFVVLHMDNTTFYKTPNIYSDTFSIRLATFLATLPTYARLLIFPYDLHMQRDFPVFISLFQIPVMAGMALVLAAFAVMALAVKLRSPKLLPLGFACAWFAVAHALHTGLFLPINAILYEHWMYLPSVGLALGVAQWLSTWNKKWMVALPVILAPTLGLLTLRQNTHWREPITFYEHILSYGEKPINVYNNLGMAYIDRGDIDKGIAQYRAAIALSDTFAQPHYNIARTMLTAPEARRNVPKAVAELERSLEINPKFYQSYELLADIYNHLGEREKALTYRQQAVTILNSR